MRYMMIYKPAGLAGESEVPPTEDEMSAMEAFINDIAASGYLKLTDGLMPSRYGVRVRREKDEYTVVDGPFTEAKELIAGFGIVEVPSLDVAISIAKRFLEVAGDGEGEIRQMHDEPAYAAP